MGNWERLGDWIATIAVASLTWVSGLIATDVPDSLPALASGAVVADQQSSILRWAQQDTEPPIEQVGEDSGDAETLDEAAAPEEATAPDDIELLDQEPPASAQEGDTELLDQGPPPTTAGTSLAPAAATSTPATTYVAPVATEFVLPEGFGTGDVHAAAGSAGFPIGLEDCHVGAVTGRAYVGIECGEGSGSSFVGHAPTFEEFPFVLDENFPFDRKSVFADRGEGELRNSVETLISAARGAPLDEDAAAPEIRTTGASSVELEQRTRDRKPRVGAEDGRANRGKKARRTGKPDVTVSSAEVAVDANSAKSDQKKKKRDKDRDQSDTAGDGKKKAKGSNHSKKHDGKKGKKSRTRK